MTSYQNVQDALTKGADPAMLCATCPWDRYCVTPPTMTKAEIDAELAKASQKDADEAAKAKALGKDPGMPVGSLMTAMVFAGRDTSGQFCPVFALRLRSSNGRAAADLIKNAMQKWDDAS